VSDRSGDDADAGGETGSERAVREDASHRRGLADLETAVGHRFGDGGLLSRALVHSSHGGESDADDNETLEFLGDAVLDLTLSDLMMREHPDFDEGKLTRLRAALVNSSRLAQAARELDLGRWIRLGKGEQRSGGREKERILAACYEALLGAIFLDAGYESCRDVVARHFADALAEPPELLDDHKTRLQELTQRLHRTTPSYRVIDVSGPDHDRRYEVALELCGEVLATGKGRSRKQAEQRAAKIATATLEARSHTADSDED
jgi:ribonuclease III